MAVRALGMLASKNQDRGSYDMTFTFKSDQDENWNHVIHLNQNNWFDLQSVKVEIESHYDKYNHQNIHVKELLPVLTRQIAVYHKQLHFV